MIKRTLMDFYADKKLFQLAKKKNPLPLIKEKFPFPWEEQSLRRVRTEHSWI